MTELPLAPVARILKRNGEDMKFTKDAKEALATELEKEALRIGKQAVKLSKADKRKTVQAKDIERWTGIDEIEGDEFIYKVYDMVRYNKDVPYTAWKNAQDSIRFMDRKFLSGKLLFRGKLYEASDVRDAEIIMESFEDEILDSLMEPHWKYNLYQFREWEPIEELEGGVKKLSMWFDDFDMGDIFIDGFLFP